MPGVVLNDGSSRTIEAAWFVSVYVPLAIGPSPNDVSTAPCLPPSVIDVMTFPLEVSYCAGRETVTLAAPGGFIRTRPIEKSRRMSPFHTYRGPSAEPN